jgi:hypothetical protein
LRTGHTALEERPAKRDLRLEVENFLPRTNWSLSIAILERSDRGISVFGRRSVLLEDRPSALRLEERPTKRYLGLEGKHFSPQTLKRSAS